MLRRIPSRSKPAVQLFCIPHAGRGPSAFRGWAKALLPEIETIIVELPGRETRFHEPPYRQMQPLVADISQTVIDGMENDLPFAFLGNSMGSVIAFETLHQIRRRTGRDAMHLFVSAAAAPHCEPILAPISHLEDQDFIGVVQERYGAIPSPVLDDKEFLASVLPTLRADIRLLEEYRYRGNKPEPLACPITAFRGKLDPTVTNDQIDAWREQTSGTFRCFSLERGHLYLDSARDFLLQHIRVALLTAEPAIGELR